MKARILTMAMAGMLGASALFAQNDKINLSSGGELIRSFKVKDIKDIIYTTPVEDGVRDIQFNFINNKLQWFLISELDAIEYKQGLPDNPYSLTVDPHHMCASVYIDGPEDTFYRLTGCRTYLLKDYDESLWADILIQQDMEYLDEVAEYYGYPLSHWPETEIFRNDLGKSDWFPDEVIPPGLEIALCLYSCRLNGDEVEVTSEPILQVFKCKEAVLDPTEFNIEADMTSTQITVKVDPVDNDEIYYNIDLFSAYDVANGDLTHLVQMSISNIEQAIYKYGAYSSWEDALFQGHGEKTWRNKCSGDMWVAVVYGVEYGVGTTNLSYEIFEIPLAEVTDDCTFEVTATQLSPSEVELNVVPSNPGTRYIAMLVDDGRIAGDPEEMLPEYYVAGQVYYLNMTNNIDWATSDLVRQGEATFTTLDGVHNGKYLPAGEQHWVLIFGVDEVGGRTTLLHKEPIKTTADENADPLLLGISFSNFDDSSEYYRFMDLRIVPSDENAKYVWDKLPSSNQYAQLDVTDEEFVNNYVKVQGQWLEVCSGTTDETFSMGQSFTSVTWEDYIFFAFGYDGAQTGPLYVYRINPVTGEVTQERGPQQ